MADIVTKNKRSFIMSRVKASKNKSTELKLIAVFKACGIKGWHRNAKVYGKPDFIFRSRKIAVFVDGCFWHGHKCRNTTPKDNAEYWANKITRNKNRDKEVSKTLKNLGWQVIRIWECELKKTKHTLLLRKLSHIIGN
jgi:DNA mismatch endonuclease (patch repair protein)